MSRSVRRLAAYAADVPKRYRVDENEVNALADAPLAAKRSNASPWGISKTLCSRKCATPSGTRFMRPFARARVSTEPYRIPMVA